MPIASNAPPYSPYRDRPLPGHNVALFIENRRNGQTLFYAPGLGEPDETLLPWLQKADCLLIDGTVWQDDELQAAGVGRNTGRDMGHGARRRARDDGPAGLSAGKTQNSHSY